MILAKLKEATKTQHLRLEKSVDLLNNALDLKSYQDLLRKFYGFYAPLESQLLRIIKEKNIDFRFEPRLKLPLLKYDLQILNGGDFEINRLEICGDLPHIETFAQSLGCLYVVEGATLGGQIIGRHLREYLNLTPENGAAFFNSYSGEVGRMWKEFGVMATAQAEILDSDEEIITAARETFTKLDGWLGADKV